MIYGKKRQKHYRERQREPTELWILVENREHSIHSANALTWVLKILFFLLSILLENKELTLSAKFMSPDCIPLGLLDKMKTWKNWNISGKLLWIPFPLPKKKKKNSFILSEIVFYNFPFLLKLASLLCVWMWAFRGLQTITTTHSVRET